MRIIAGFLHSPEGVAALERAIEEARLRDAELVVVHNMKDDVEALSESEDDLAEMESRLGEEDVAYRIRGLVRGNSPAEDLLLVADEEDADLIVIGVRRRSAVGKLVLGSNAQDILLGADCPVLAVKAATAG